MKLVILDAAVIGNDLDLSRLEQFGDLEIFSHTKSEQIHERSFDANIIITNKVIFDSEQLKQLPNLKLICIAATGMNNIDLDFCREAGIAVKNVLGYSTESVAQLTLTFALNFLGNIQKYNEFTKEDKWIKSSGFTQLDYPIADLSQKKWGIIGMGTIGRRVAEIACAFGAEVSYFSTSAKNNKNKYPQVELKCLLESSDIISIHCPLNENTNDLLNASNLSLISENSILINVGRGSIINEKDLFDLLRSKNIYVGLDVIENEPMVEGSYSQKLARHENVIMTPHIAWASLESRNKLLDGIIENITQTLTLG